METTTTRLKSGRTSRAKASKAFKNVPTALLLKKKAECDARALKIVERMMEPKVDVDWLLTSLGAISKCHMEDAAEERSIVKLCGYVLCDNPLTKVVAKRYQISTLRNKVYDIDKVRNYCSYGCYRAAVYLMEQMQTSPLWLRDSEEKLTFRLLAKKKDARFPSPPGVEVDLLGVKLPEDADETETESRDEAKKDRKNHKTREEKDSSERDSVRLENTEEDERAISYEEESNFTPGQKENSAELALNVAAEIAKLIAPTPQNENSAVQSAEATEKIQSKLQAEHSAVQLPKAAEATPQKFQNGNPAAQLPKAAEAMSQMSQNGNPAAQLPKTDAVIAGPNPSKPARKSSERRRSERRQDKISTNATICFNALTSRVENCFREWITGRTLSLLHGETEEKREILEGVQREERYAILCKKLNQLQLQVKRGSSEGIGDLRPAPDFLALREEARGLELKVRAFWQGKTAFDRTDSRLADCSPKNDEDVETILPIDLHAPNVQRRRIFLDRLNKVMPDLLRALVDENYGCSAYTYTAERCAGVKALVSTFSLSATNIVFKTAEWTLVSLVIIKLLGIMDPRTRYLLSRKQAHMHISLILMSYKLQSNYLDNLIASLTSPPNIDETEIQPEV